MAMRVHDAEYWLQRSNEMLQSIDPEVVAQAATIGAKVAVASFTVRTVYVAISKASGFYTPSHYHKFPRIPWRVPYKAWMDLKIWWERTALIGKRGSTGGFASAPTVMTMLFKPGKVLIGRVMAFNIGLFQPIGISPQRHLSMLAMTGGGKTSLLKSIISTYKGSVLLIDPDYGVMDEIMERDSREWAMITPYREGSASFNVFELIKEMQKRFGEDTAVLWALRIAAALIISPAGSRTPYFYDVSRQYLGGLILHVLTHHPEEEHNLCTVRDLIINGYRIFDDEGNETTTPAKAHALQIKLMLNNSAFGGMISGSASALASASGEAGGNVRSTLQDQTRWLDIPEVQKVIRTTTISLSQLKTSNDIAIGLAAPLSSIREELSRLSRMLTNMSYYTFEAIKEKKGICLFCIDELPSQQYNPIYKTILAAGRKHGVIMLAIAQSIAQLKEIDPHNYLAYIGETDLVWWMGGNHPSNFRLLSEILGKKTVIEKDKYSGRKTYREVPVMVPDQVKRFLDPNSDNMIITQACGRAFKAMKMPSHEWTSVFRRHPSSEHKEPLLHRFIRFFFDRNPAPKAATATTPKLPEQEFETAFEPENVIPFPSKQSVPDQANPEPRGNE